MLVKYLVSLAGGDHAGSAGDFRDIDAAEAKRLIEAGYAEVAADPKVGVETAARTRAKAPRP